MEGLSEFVLTAVASAIGAGVSIGLASKLWCRPAARREDAAVGGPTQQMEAQMVPVDPLIRVRGVAFDFATLFEVVDRRNPWRQIARLSPRPLDPNGFFGSIREYAAESGVEWEERWAEDEAAELQSIRVRDGSLDTALLQ